MTRPLRLMTLACLLAVVTLLGGCAGEDPEAAEEQLREQEWTAVQQAHEQLEAKRQRLEELREQAGGGEEGEVSAEEVQAQAQALGQEIQQEAGDFYNKLVEFINSDPPVQGEPLSERQLAAIRLKGDEDISLAQEYIDEGGDYGRAIQIYQDALLVDPENERVKEKLAEAEERRYMSQERFSAVKKGMTESEVTEVLGRPYYRNVREFEDRGVRAWFYPKDETRAAAAVWFEKKGGTFKVYKIDFNASKGQES